MSPPRCSVGCSTASAAARAGRDCSRARPGSSTSGATSAGASLEEALAESGDDTGLRGEIEEGLAWGLLLLRRNLPAAAAHARSAAALAEERADDGALAEALAASALTEFALGRPWEEAMRRAVSLEPALGEHVHVEPEGIRLMPRSVVEEHGTRRPEGEDES